MTKREPRFELSRTQDLEACYHDAGSFYWGLNSLWMSDHGLHSNPWGYPSRGQKGSISIRPMTGHLQSSLQGQ